MREYLNRASDKIIMSGLADDIESGSEQYDSRVFHFLINKEIKLYLNTFGNEVDKKIGAISPVIRWKKQNLMPNIIGFTGVEKNMLGENHRPITFLHAGGKSAVLHKYNNCFYIKCSYGNRSPIIPLWIMLSVFVKNGEYESLNKRSFDKYVIDLGLNPLKKEIYNGIMQ